MTDLHSHCQHGVYLRHDICMSCIQLIGDDHWLCTNCGVSGNWEWTEDHLLNCAGITPRDLDKDPIPF